MYVLKKFQMLDHVESGFEIRVISLVNSIKIFQMCTFFKIANTSDIKNFRWQIFNLYNALYTIKPIL